VQAQERGGRRGGGGGRRGRPHGAEAEAATPRQEERDGEVDGGSRRGETASVGQRPERSDSADPPAPRLFHGAAPQRPDAGIVS